MGAIRVFSNLGNLTDFKAAARFFAAFIQEATQVINGRLNFVSNFEAAGPYEVSFPTPGAAVAVNHSLGKVPSGYLVVNQSGLFSVGRPSGLAWTNKTIYLCATANLTTLTARAEDGTLLQGEGLTVVKNSTGNYTARYSSEFSEVPVVNITCETGSGGPFTGMVVNIDASNVVFETKDAAGVLQNMTTHISISGPTYDVGASAVIYVIP